MSANSEVPMSGWDHGCPSEVNFPLCFGSHPRAISQCWPDFLPISLGWRFSPALPVPTDSHTPCNHHSHHPKQLPIPKCVTSSQHCFNLQICSSCSVGSYSLWIVSIVVSTYTTEIVILSPQNWSRVLSLDKTYLTQNRFKIFP